MLKFNVLNKEINLFNQYSNDILEFVKKQFNQPEFSIPTFNTYLRLLPGLGEKLLEKYGNNYRAQKKYDKVSEDVKLFQSAMDEGMIFALNKETGKLGIYTSRERTLNLLEVDYKFDKEKTCEKNAEGVIHCMRLDFSYEGYGDLSVEVKATSRDKITPDTHILIPVRIIEILENTIRKVLEGKKTILKITQNKNGIAKERFVTVDPSTLAKYNENGEVVVDVIWSFDSIASMYIPVLGAPSNTLAMTRVDLLDIDKIEVVKDNGKLVEIGKSDLEGMLAPQIFSWMLKILIDRDKTKAKLFLDILSKIPSVKESIKEEINTENLDEYAGKILSSIKNVRGEELEVVKAHFSLQFVERIEHYKNIFKKYEQVEIPSSLDELEKLMYTGGFKLTYITSGNKVSQIYCTKSSDLLKDVYGEDYDRKYASIGNRIRTVKRKIADGGNQEALMKEYNLETLEEPEINYVKDDFVRVNVLFAPYTKNEVVDFYRTIKLEKILSIHKLV